MGQPAEVPAVTVNGKPVDTSAIDNYDGFMAYLMQASAAANLAKIRKYYEDRTSQGETQNFPLAVTPAPQLVECAHASQSLFVVNDGPGQIFVAINDVSRTPTPLLVGESLSIDFETHIIQRFFVWSAAGTVAAARAVAAF